MYSNSYLYGYHPHFYPQMHHQRHSQIRPQIYSQIHSHFHPELHSHFHPEARPHMVRSIPRSDAPFPVKSEHDQDDPLSNFTHIKQEEDDDHFINLPIFTIEREKESEEEKVKEEDEEEEQEQEEEEEDEEKKEKEKNRNRNRNPCRSYDLYLDNPNSASFSDSAIASPTKEFKNNQKNSSTSQNVKEESLSPTAAPIDIDDDSSCKRKHNPNPLALTGYGYTDSELPRFIPPISLHSPSSYSYSESNPIYYVYSTSHNPTSTNHITNNNDHYKADKSCIEYHNPITSYSRNPIHGNFSGCFYTADRKDININEDKHFIYSPQNHHNIQHHCIVNSIDSSTNDTIDPEKQSEFDREHIGQNRRTRQNAISGPVSSRFDGTNGESCKPNPSSSALSFMSDAPVAKIILSSLTKERIETIHLLSSHRSKQLKEALNLLLQEYPKHSPEITIVCGLSGHFAPSELSDNPQSTASPNTTTNGNNNNKNNKNNSNANNINIKSKNNNSNSTSTDDNDENKIKRPLNSFMLYRKWQIRRLFTDMVNAPPDMCTRNSKNTSTNTPPVRRGLILRRSPGVVEEKIDESSNTIEFNFSDKSNKINLKEATKDDKKFKDTDDVVVKKENEDSMDIEMDVIQIKEEEDKNVLNTHSHMPAAAIACAPKEIIFSNQTVSQIIAVLWNTESAEVRSAFAKLAQDEKELHSVLHPNYKFQPKRKPKNQKNSPQSIDANLNPKTIVCNNHNNSTTNYDSHSHIYTNFGNGKDIHKSLSNSNVPIDSVDSSQFSIASSSWNSLNAKNPASKSVCMDVFVK